MEDVVDLDTIDIELDDDFKKKETRRCTDAFLNSLCDKEVDDILIPEIESEEKELGTKSTHDSCDEEIDSKEIVNASSEEDDQVTFNYSTHDPNIKWNKMRPERGERYETPHQLKLCLTNYDINNGYRIRFKKCDSVRLVAVCASDEKFQCPFLVRASWMSTEKSFQIKKIVDQHKCIRNYNNSKLIDPTWIARQFLKELIRKPNLKCKEMQGIIQSKFHCKVSWSKCYRARCRAMSLIEGKLSDHYARIWDYGHELMRSNPGSTVKVCVTQNPDQTTTFHRMYICFKAVKDGWKVGCRRVIGLDGSFLKGQCKGEMLTAIGRDANNQVYPIAWAVVDIENKPNWKWFLELIEDDLGLDGGRGMCVISDQHKGLLEATKEILPFVEHRQCAKHIYANFRKVYSGVEFKNMFWAAAKSTVEGEFKLNMQKIKQISPAAYEHLMGKEPNSWCRAFFGSGLACEAVENGMAECFNAIIMEARKKPLLTMLEEIRLYMMERFFNLKETAEKWDSQVCPGAIKKMEKFAQYIRSWYVHPSGLSAYEVRDGFESYGVDLQGNFCTCRLWEVSGIPCVHAQAAILYTQQDPVEFISSWFSKDKFIASYASNIQPVNGSNLWVETPYTKPLPPLEKRMPGRPSIKRKRHVSEYEDKYSQVSGKGRTVQCTNCLQKGHNKLSCKNPKVIPDPKPKKKMGRPRLDPDLNHWTKSGKGLKRGGRATRGGGRGNRGENSVGLGV
ncbi:hypothetical protein L2E82_31868 [Cichorium intybus]|uniref:Uncharacterized protein n=1 Tax=Cichorium intybus TaxID=13427 RepID=A0ACB9BFX5_CICIN|nr:hypothetical protein L2E82_31868 [Cichorium intybus]